METDKCGVLWCVGFAPLATNKSYRRGFPHTIGIKSPLIRATRSVDKVYKRAASLSNVLWRREHFFWSNELIRDNV